MNITKDRVLESLIQSKTIREASKKAGVSERVIYKYLNEDKDFRSQYNQLRADSLKSVADSLGAGAEQAVDIIIDIMEHSDKEHNRLRACSLLLDYHLKALELIDIEDRLEAIEREVYK